jgi:hypothetical protein
VTRPAVLRDYALGGVGTTPALRRSNGATHLAAMELTLIFSLFGAVALTLVVPAVRGMFR